MIYQILPKNDAFIKLDNKCLKSKLNEKVEDISATNHVQIFQIKKIFLTHILKKNSLSIGIRSRYIQRIS